MKKLISLAHSVCLSLLFLLPSFLISQEAIITDQTGGAAPDLDKCSRNGTETITIQFQSITNSATLNLTLPTGVTYVCGTVSKTSGIATINIADAVACDPTAPVFDVTGLSAAGDNITFEVELSADCSATAGSNQLTVSVSGAGDNDCDPCSAPVLFEVLEASLQVQLNMGGFAHADETGLAVQSTGDVDITLSNLGQGCLDSLRFCIDDVSGFVRTTSLMIGGNTITGTMMGTQMCYVIRASDDPANFGGDGLLCNTETLTLTRAYEIVGCTASGQSISNTYTANYGCTPVGVDCQMDVSGTGNFSLAFGAPNIVHTATTFQAGSTCTDHIIEATFTNVGNGDDEASVAYNIIHNTGLGDLSTNHISQDWTVTNIDLVTDMGTTVPLSFTGGFPASPITSMQQAMADLSQLDGGTDPDGVGNGLSDEDGDGEFDDLAVGATYTVRITYSFQCPDSCDPEEDIRFGIYNYIFDYEDQCSNRDNITAVMPSLFISRRILLGQGASTSPLNLSDGETASTELNISWAFSDNALTCNTNNTVNAAFELPMGITVADSPNYIYNNSSTTGFVNSGTADTANVQGTYAGGAGTGTLIFGFDFTLDCDKFGSSGSIKIPYTVTYECDACPDCQMVVVCDTLNLEAICPANCSEGGLTMVDIVLERTSLGFTDETATDRVDASSISAIQLARVNPCDTAKLSISTVQVPGTNIPSGASDNAFIELVYDEPGGSRVYAFAGGTFTHYDADMMTTSAPINLPNPSDTDVGGQHIMAWELASLLPGGVIEDNDSLIICANLIVLDNTDLPNAPTQLSGSLVNSFNLASGYTNPLPNGDERFTCLGLILENYPFRYFPTVFLSNNLNPIGCGQLNIAFALNAGEGPSTDPFPGEIRPNVVIDSFVIDLGSTNYVLDTGSDALLSVGGNPSDGPYNQNSVVTPDRVSATEIVFINDNSEFIFPDYQNVSNSGYRLTVPVFPSCASQSGTVVATAYFKQNAQNLNFSCTPSNSLSSSQNSSAVNQATFQLVDETGIKTGDEEIECFELTLRNTSTSVDGSFVFLQLEDENSDMTVVSARHLSTNTSTVVDTALNLLPYSDGQWIQLVENMPANEVYSIEVCVQNNGCDVSTLPIGQGFDCAGFPNSPNDLPCEPTTDTLRLNPIQAGLQGELTLQPQNPITLCEDYTYELLITSSGIDDLLNPNVLIDLPQGLTITGAEIAYPFNTSLNPSTGYTGTTETAMLNFSVTNDSVTINLSDAMSIIDSLPGGISEQTNEAPLEDREALVRFTFASDCDFISGATIPFQLNGNSPCGDVLAPVNLLSTPLRLSGIQEELDVAIDLNLASNEINCGNTTIAPDLTYIDTNADGSPYLTGSTDTVRVELPQGVVYVAASYSQDDVNAPSFEGVEIENGKQVLILVVPANVSVPNLGSILTGFEFDVSLDLDNSTCDQTGEVEIIYQQTFPSLFCSTIGMDCMNGATANLGTASASIIFQKTEITNFSIDMPSFSGTFDLVGTDLPAGDSLIIEAFCANDFAMTTPFGSTTVYGPITSGTTNIPFSIDYTDGTCLDNLGLVKISPTVTTGTAQCVCTEAMSPDALLPVELIDFKAVNEDCSVELQWTTASELNNQYFEVTYSEDGKNFKPLGRVEGAGTTLNVQSYHFIHHFPAIGVNYYRLKQVDFDGNFSYSKTIAMKHHCKDDQIPFKAYPSPLSEADKLHVQLYTTSTKVELYISALDGRIIQTTNLEANKGWNTFELNLNHLPAGSYFIQTEMGEIARFVKMGW